MREAKLTELKGVGPAVAKDFAAIGLHSVYDLLHYFPRAYNDYSQITDISKISPGMVTIRAEIKQAKGRYVRRGLHITEAAASDKTGSVRLVWFNQPYRAGGLKTDQEYFITGKLELKAGRFAINNPGVELVSDLPVHTARIVPIYRESKGVAVRTIRRAMAEAVKHVTELDGVLPAGVIKSHELMTYPEALRQLHFPDDTEKLELAKRTMAFIEVYELMLASKILKAEISSEPAPPITFDEKLAKKFVGSLPFKLTDAQRAAAWQVLQDMEKSTPMNRLVEGDVGSGKTVVAALAAIMSLNAGCQAAFLAPTELLARQHAESIVELLRPLGLDKGVGLLVGSLKPAQKKAAHEAIKKGKMRFVIGTHALLQDAVELDNLGLLVVDEQHRFGVEQRKALLGRSGKMPHVLSMTATPIPRSLALTLYGELDISLLDAMPPGRKTIETTLVSPNSREKLNQHILEEVEAGRQTYVVCPVITEDNKLQTTSAEATFKRLQTTFRGKKVALLHGKLKPDEKIEVMEQFVSGKTDILVSTTVIEVGVNVPNATVMVIEGADRFGLAQLHQLRGRVGRSTQQSYCYIVPSDSSAPSQRLRSFVRLSDGFRLAELDLKLRGPGAIYGVSQHGVLDLRFATLTDTKLLAEVRQAVNDFVKNDDLKKYPELSRRVRKAQAVITLN